MSETAEFIRFVCRIVRVSPVPLLPFFCAFPAGSVLYAQQVTFEFDHLKENASRSWRVDLERDQEFVFRITNTCSDDFQYRLEALPPGVSPPRLGIGILNPLNTKEVREKHDPRWGGYVLHIDKIATSNSCHIPTDERKEADLKPVLLFVSVATPDWNVSVAGGFTVSTVTNQVFGTQLANGKYLVVREDDKEDAVTLGLASFVVVHHSSQPAWLPAPSFGLGIHSDNKLTYNIGGAYRFGDKGAFSLGIAFGPSTRLPDGVRLNVGLDTAPSLANLPTRTRLGFFVGLSYSLIDTREQLQKPFKGAPETQK
jgi:hypothetical protein